MDREGKGGLIGAGAGVAAGVAFASVLGPVGLVLPIIYSLIGRKVAKESAPKPKARDKDRRDDQWKRYLDSFSENRFPYNLPEQHRHFISGVNHSVHDTGNHYTDFLYRPRQRENYDDFEDTPITMTPQQNIQAGRGQATQYNNQGLQGARGTVRNETYFRRKGG